MINDLFNLFKKCKTYDKFNIECNMYNVKCKIDEKNFYEIKEEIDFYRLVSYEMMIV